MPSGRIKAVYCHWDGHPDTKEKELKKYKDKKSIIELIKKGSMSSLDTTLTWDNETRKSQPLYHSERGENWAICKPRVSISKREAIRFWSGWDCEYLYVFTPDGWKTFTLKGEN